MNSYVRLKITGPHIKRFLKRLRNINIYNIKYESKDSIIILVNNKDYNKIIKLKTIYNIKILSYKGYLNLKEKIYRYKVFIISNIVVFIFIILLSNIILKINIIHNSEDVRNEMKEILKNYGIEEHKFKKNRNELKKIIKDISYKNKDKIEWMEIEEKGTTLNVRLEERKINKVKELNNVADIVASKNGIVKKIIAQSGDIMTCIDCYVNKDDILISSDIKLNDEIKNEISASGKVYAEVWYKIKISSPYIIHYDINKNNNKFVISYNYINKNKDIINRSYKFYKNKFIKNFRFLFSPLSLDFKIENEIIRNEINLTDEELKDYMMDLASKKLSLDKDAYIIKKEILNRIYDVDKLNLELFFTVYENIAKERLKY